MMDFFENMSLVVYKFMLQTLGRVIPESIVYYLCFISLVIAIIITAFLTMFQIKKLWQQSPISSWINTLLNEGFRKIRRIK